MQSILQSILVPIAVSAIALSVVGCSTGAQQEVARIQSVSAEYGAAGQDCVQKIADNPDYAPLKAKTPFATPPQFSLEMLNDRSSPNKKGISLLYRMYGDRQQCNKIILDGAAKMNPLYQSVLIESYSDADKLWAQATAGRLTWGQFNQGRKDLLAQLQQRDIQVTAQINSQLQSQHQAELAARAAAIANTSHSVGDYYRARGEVQVPQQRTINCNTTATGPDTSYSTCQ
jgi:cell division septum initiation protein DivIVA